MPEITDVLARLADDPPAAPLPVDELRARAERRRRRHRHRVTAAAVVGTAAALVVAVAGSAVTHPDPELTTVGPPAPAGGDEPTLSESRGGLAVAPSTDLHDGSTVTLALDPDPGGEVVATQCAAEVLEFTDEERGDVAGLPTEWCGSVHYLRSPAGRSDLTMEVTRTQRARSGDIDCGSAPGRCVVMVGSGYVGDRFAPLAFDQDAPWIVGPELELVDVEGPVEDGQLVAVRGRGFALPAGEVVVMQCIGELDDPFNQGDSNCDVARSVFRTTRPDGTFSTRIRVFREILAQDTGRGVDDGTTSGAPVTASWTPCQPCVLLVGDARLSLDVVAAPAGGAVHPELEVASPGPHQPGARVRIEGRGFQAGQAVSLTWCPAGEWRACVPPGEGFATADAAGEVAVDGFPLPDAGDLGGACTREAGACVVAWTAPWMEGRGPAVTVPLDLPGAS